MDEDLHARIVALELVVGQRSAQQQNMADTAAALAGTTVGMLRARGLLSEADATQIFFFAQQTVLLSGDAPDPLMLSRFRDSMDEAMREFRKP